MPLRRLESSFNFQVWGHVTIIACPIEDSELRSKEASLVSTFSTSG